MVWQYSARRRPQCLLPGRRDGSMRRSSHALIESQHDIETDCHTAAELFESFATHKEWDVICFAHCGGRYADITMAHDGSDSKNQSRCIRPGVRLSGWFKTRLTAVIRVGNHRKFGWTQRTSRCQLPGGWLVRCSRRLDLLHHARAQQGSAD